MVPVFNKIYTTSQLELLALKVKLALQVLKVMLA
jgi:hypothetical protein